MRAANAASTLGTVQLCCSKFGLGADGMVDVGDIVSHDATSRRGNNHSARQKRTDMFRMILLRQPHLSVLGTATARRETLAMRTSTDEAERAPPLTTQRYP